MSHALRPRTWVGLGGLVGLTVLIFAASLVAVGLALGQSLRPVTYVGLVGGAVAAVVTMAILEVNLEVSESERAELRALQWVHVAYLSVAGALYPAVVAQGLGLSGEWYVELPLAIASALCWSVTVFLPAAAAYVLSGEVPLDRNVLRDWARLLGLFLIYGVVLGLIVGAYRSVWAPLFGF